MMAFPLAAVVAAVVVLAAVIGLIAFAVHRDHGE